MKRRLMMVMGVVVMLVVLGAGTAMAANEFELRSLDGDTFELWYDYDNDGASWTVQAYDFRIDTNGIINVAASSAWDPFAAGAPGQPQPDGSGVSISAFSFAAPTTAVGATLIMTIEMTVAGDVWFNYGHPSFEWLEADWMTTHNGTEMTFPPGGYTNPILNPGDTTPGDGMSDPVAPIPEIITIVLVSLGLVALGGYIWYRRRNMAQIAA